jgi:hypothetical protein
MLSSFIKLSNNKKINIFRCQLRQKFFHIYFLLLTSGLRPIRLTLTSTWPRTVSLLRQRQKDLQVQADWQDQPAENLKDQVQFYGFYFIPLRNETKFNKYLSEFLIKMQRVRSKINALKIFCLVKARLNAKWILNKDSFHQNSPQSPQFCLKTREKLLQMWLTDFGFCSIDRLGKTSYLIFSTRIWYFSARKKTTELSKILSKMERNRINDVREKAAAAKGTPSK